MSLVLFLHIFFIGIWFGCVAVEMVIERGRWASKIAPQLHYAVDRCVEIPAFSIVLITGLILFDAQKFGGLYAIKVVCGLIAVGINAYCFLPVSRRKVADDAGDREQIRKHSRRIYETLLVGLPAALIALGIGLHFLGIY